MIHIVFFILVAFKGSFAACLQDSKLISIKENSLTQKIENAADNFQNFVDSFAPQEMKVVVKLDYLNPRINAEVKKINQEIIIEVWGGMLKHYFMNEYSMKLLLCHELGHAFGGAPYKSRGGWSSTEGQSDYFSGLECAHRLGLSESDFFEAALRLAKIYADVAMEPAPDLDACDETIVTRTNFGYPKAQCRLDTLVAGWRRQDRPRCWFSE